MGLASGILSLSVEADDFFNQVFFNFNIETMCWRANDEIAAFKPEVEVQAREEC